MSFDDLCQDVLAEICTFLRFDDLIPFTQTCKLMFELRETHPRIFAGRVIYCSYCWFSFISDHIDYRDNFIYICENNDYFGDIFVIKRPIYHDGESLSFRQISPRHLRSTIDINIYVQWSNLVRRIKNGTAEKYLELGKKYIPNILYWDGHLPEQFKNFTRNIFHYTIENSDTAIIDKIIVTDGKMNQIMKKGIYHIKNGMIFRISLD